MTPADFDFLRGLLKRRSGLVLSSDKQYLVESRLLPVARKAGFDHLSALIDALKADKTEMLMTAVVEAMTTNEIFLFSRQGAFRQSSDHRVPRTSGCAAAFTRAAHLVRRRRKRPGALLTGDGTQRNG